MSKNFGTLKIIVMGRGYCNEYFPGSRYIYVTECGYNTNFKKKEKRKMMLCQVKFNFECLSRLRLSTE